jgi:hypothetical protein
VRYAYVGNQRHRACRSSRQSATRTVPTLRAATTALSCRTTSTSPNASTTAARGRPSCPDRSTDRGTAQTSSSRASTPHPTPSRRRSTATSRRQNTSSGCARPSAGAGIAGSSRIHTISSTARGRTIKTTTQLLGGGCVRGGAPRLGVVVLPKICRLGLPASDKLRLGPRHLANFARYLFLGPVQGGGTPVGWRLRSGPAGVSLSPVSEAVVRRSHW